MSIQGAEAAEDNRRTSSGSWRMTVLTKKSPTDRRFLLVSQIKNSDSEQAN